MKTRKKQAKLHTSEVLNSFFSVDDKKEYEKTEKNMLLATRIEEAMKRKGYSKMQFALAMQVQPSVVTKWLSGTHNFTTDTLYDIESVLAICLVNVTETQTSHVIGNVYATLSSNQQAAAGAACFLFTRTNVRTAKNLVTQNAFLTNSMN